MSITPIKNENGSTKCSHCNSINPCYDREFVYSCIEKYSSDPINKTKTEQTICFKCGSVYKQITEEELLAKGRRDLEKALARYVKVPYIHSEGHMFVKKENWDKLKENWEKRKEERIKFITTESFRK
jgi:hypothetical protein